MYLQFRFYLDLCKTKIFLSRSPHCDGNSYADKLKNPHMRKNQQTEKSACWKPALKAIKRGTHLVFNAIKMLKKISLALLTQVET